MNADQQKIVQYLNEAHASEIRRSTRVLQSQIAMTPRGRYRDALEQPSLQETRSHAERVQRAPARAGRRAATRYRPASGSWKACSGQLLALSKTPFDLLRGSGGEEKILKNAKDTCATEALEIATYAAIEHVAERVGDQKTARLAASIRADEERMLARVMRALPPLSRGRGRRRSRRRPDL